MDSLEDGYISPLDFYDIMVSLKNHLLTNFVKENLVTVGWAFFCNGRSVHVYLNFNLDIACFLYLKGYQAAICCIFYVDVKKVNLVAILKLLFSPSV